MQSFSVPAMLILAASLQSAPVQAMTVPQEVRIPGGYKVSDDVFYTGARQKLGNGDEVTEGLHGRILGPAMPYHADAVQVQFDGQSNSHNLWIARLRSEEVSIPEGQDGWEAKDGNGKWWAITVLKYNPGGTYAVKVHDGHDTEWPICHTSNMRRLNHQEFSKGEYVRSVTEIHYGATTVPVNTSGEVMGWGDLKGHVNWKGFAGLTKAVVFSNQIRKEVLENAEVLGIRSGSASALAWAFASVLLRIAQGSIVVVVLAVMIWTHVSKMRGTIGIALGEKVKMHEV